MKKISIIFVLLLSVVSFGINAQQTRLNGFNYVEAYLNPKSHELMLGYTLGIINGFNRGLLYEHMHLDCTIPQNDNFEDIGNSIAISIAANKHLQKEFIDTAILEGYALAFCKKASEES